MKSFFFKLLKQYLYSINIKGPSTTNSNMERSFSKATLNHLSLKTVLVANPSMANPFLSLTAMSTGDKDDNCCASKLLK